MDLGMFRPGKKGFLLWVIGPLVAMIAVSLPVALYTRHMRRECDRRQALLRQIPEMNRQVDRARANLRSVIVKPTGGSADDGAAEVSQRIYRAAQEHGFAIRSLTAAKGEATGGLMALTVSVQGDGALSDIIGMFDDLHAPQQLCAVNMVRLKAPRNGAEKLLYGGEIVFQCHVASIANDN